MADSQQIQKLIESVVARVFDRRISELRKDLHRGVGESLGSRVSELQLDVETGVAEVFSARVAEIGADVGAGISEVLEGRGSELRKEVDKSLSEVIQKRTADVREHLAQGVTALIDERVSELRGGLEEGVELAIARRITELRKELQDVVQDVAGKRISNLRREVERIFGEKAEGRFDELRKDVAKNVAEAADRRIAELRKDAEKVASRAAGERLGNLRKDVERIVGEVAEKRVASIRKDLERVVAEAGEQRITELRKEVVMRAAEEIEKAFSGKAADGSASTLLDSAMASIHESRSQTDILRALLEGVASFAPRVGLFVVKGALATGWQARGFEDNTHVKKITVETGSGLAARVIEKRGAVNAAAREFEPAMLKSAGSPADGNCLVLPLLVKDRVPALIYADAGTGAGRVDAAALQLLVRSAGLWLEVVTLRKIADGAVGEEPQMEVAAAAAAASAPASARAPAPPPAPSKRSAAPAQPLSAEDEEVHKRARRFAKLLVDEIKLYNQGKVAEGRQHHDLYDRLKEDIEKSRASYEKRYGNTPAANGNYFNQEVIRILADNDASVLGNNFPH